MRVRMLKTHEVKESHAEHGELSLVYGAGSTQSFDPTTAQSLIASKLAVEHPETSQRVQMLRTLTETEVIELANHAREAAGVVAFLPVPTTGNAFRYPKGALVHLATELADALIAVGAAKDAPDTEADPIAATKAAAIEVAIVRKKQKEDEERRRAEQKARVDAVRASRSSAGSGAPTPRLRQVAPHTPADAQTVHEAAMRASTSSSATTSMSSTSSTEK